MSDRTVWILRGLRLLLGVALVVAVPGAAQAATVTSTADTGTGSLRDAITTSAGGDTIDFAPALNGQTITLTSGALMITHSLTISGPGAGNLTVSGTHNGTVFDEIQPEPPGSTSLTISGLTITGGVGVHRRRRDLREQHLRLKLNGDTITGNQVTLGAANAAGGGGVYINGGTLTVTGSTITNNSVEFHGRRCFGRWRWHLLQRR